MAHLTATLEIGEHSLVIDRGEDAIEILQLPATYVAVSIENEGGEPLILKTVDLLDFEPHKRASGIMAHLYPFLSDDLAAIATAVKKARSIDKVVEDMFNDATGATS